MVSRSRRKTRPAPEAADNGTETTTAEARSERRPLVLRIAFRGRGDYHNLTVKKIPKRALARCEWGHDDYSLRVENLPKAPPKPGQQSLFGDDGEE